MQRDRKRIERIDHKENRVLYRRAKHAQRRGYLEYAAMVDRLVEEEGWKLAEPPVEYEMYFEPYYDEDYDEWVTPPKTIRVNYRVLVPSSLEDKEFYPQASQCFEHYEEYLKRR